MKLRDKVFAAKDIKEEKVYVPEWDVELLVKGMTGEARSEIMQNCLDLKTGATDLKKLYPLLLIGTVYDPETGEKVFGEADRDMLNQKSGGALERVAKVAMKLSGLDEESLNQAEKN